MISLFEPHPNAWSFYCDAIGANVLLALLFTQAGFVFTQMMRSDRTPDDVANTAHGMLPLAVVFAGLYVGLSMRMSAAAMTTIST